MICPYCEQGSILKAKVKKNGMMIHICDECDTVWTSEQDISNKSGERLDIFMEKLDCEPYWDELEVLE